MKLAIFWADLMYYHISRLQALMEAGSQLNHLIFPFALSPKSPELPVAGYQDLLGDRIKVLSDDPSVTGAYSRTSKSQLLKYLSVSNPDVVAIIGYDGKVSRAAVAWCRYHRKAAVLMFVSQEMDLIRRPWKEAVKSLLVRCYDSALVGGTRHIEYAVKLGMARDRILTGYNVVDNRFWYDSTERVRTDEQLWRDRYGLPKQYFLSAGRFIPKKNFERLIRSYAAYFAQTSGEPWSLVIAGDGDLRPKLKALVEEMGLKESVHFPGYLPPKDMAPVYALASAFVLPSAFFEQWGLVVNEAMAAGLPILVSNICGCAPDLVIEGVTGFTFNPLDEAKLTQLLLCLSNTSTDLKRMGTQSRTLIMEKYSPSVFAQNLLTAAEAAIAHANSRRWQIYPSPWLWP